MVNIVRIERDRHGRWCCPACGVPYALFCPVSDTHTEGICPQCESVIGVPTAMLEIVRPVLDLPERP